MNIVYKEFKDYLKQKKVMIENDLFLRYIELFVKENDGWLLFKKKIDVIQLEIDVYIKCVVEKVECIGKQIVVSL